MIKFPLILKKAANSAGYIDGWRNYYELAADGFFYPTDPIEGGKLSNVRINSDYVKILSSDHKQLLSVSHNNTITETSPDQKEKGIGIVNDEEKVRTVLQQGDCSDQGASEPQVLSAQNRQQSQLLSALTDSG